MAAGRQKLIVDYTGHSGFLVETAHCLMLFDYYKGDLSVLDKKPAEKPLFIFASHAHADHFNPDIFRINRGFGQVTYLLAFDIKGDRRIPADAGEMYLDAGRRYDVPGLGTVETYMSNDEGVAFFVDADGTHIYHAGDLNMWNWEGEDPDWLKWQEEVYKSGLQKLSEHEIDAAFVVLDDRLEEHFAEGLELFLSTCSARCVFPMHFWHDRSVIERFKAQTQTEKGAAQIMDTAKKRHWEVNL